jgi:hypothetical protein
VRKKQLPKARLLSVRLVMRNSWRIMKFRHANAACVYVGPFIILWRMPWLPDVARQLHPECFDK